MIRNYTPEDYEMILSWWNSSGEMPPLPGMLPTETTFIIEKDFIPMACVTLYPTNCLEVCYVENFVGNPAVKGENRKKASQELSDYIADYARGLGFKRLVCLAHQPKLVDHYQWLGFSVNISGLTALAREI